MNELPHPGFFKDFRICPNCNSSFTADTETKNLQKISTVILVVSLVATILLYFVGTEWLILAITSYVILGLVVYWGSKRMYLVPYQKGSKTDDKN